MSARTRWFDETTQAPRIDELARKLDSFVDTMADGRVDDQEMQDQEERVVELMKAVEPLLDEEAHAKVTQLLCELTAYDLMRIMHAIQRHRPKTKFQG